MSVFIQINEAIIDEDFVPDHVSFSYPRLLSTSSLKIHNLTFHPSQHPSIPPSIIV